MKPLHSLLVSLLLVMLVACDGDIGTAKVTYIRATAIYDDLGSIRNTPLLGPTREIVDPGKIFVSDNLLLIGEEGEGIHVFDNRNEENPIPLTFLQIPGNREYYIHDEIIYAESIYDMLKINITDVNNPYLEARLENSIYHTLNNARGEALVGFAFQEVTEEIDINDNDFDSYNNYPVVYYDFANNLIPASAVPTSFAGSSNSGIGSINRIAYYEGYVYMVSRSQLAVFDARSGLEKVHGDYWGWNMETVYPFENRLYIGSQSAMDVMNIENPESPEPLAHFWHEESCDPVLPANINTAYLTLRTGDFSQCPGNVNELHVLTMGNHGEMRSTQSIEMKSPYGMTLIGNELYVGEGEHGFKIFDATDRNHLRLVRHVREIPAYDIIAHPVNSNLILISGPESFSQYRIGNDFDLDLLSTIHF